MRGRVLVLTMLLTLIFLSFASLSFAGRWSLSPLVLPSCLQNYENQSCQNYLIAGRSSLRLRGRLVPQGFSMPIDNVEITIQILCGHTGQWQYVTVYHHTFHNVNGPISLDETFTVPAITHYYLQKIGLYVIVGFKFIINTNGEPHEILVPPEPDRDGCVVYYPPKIFIDRQFETQVWKEGIPGKIVWGVYPEWYVDIETVPHYGLSSCVRDMKVYYRISFHGSWKEIPCEIKGSRCSGECKRDYECECFQCEWTPPTICSQNEGGSCEIEDERDVLPAEIKIEVNTYAGTISETVPIRIKNMKKKIRMPISPESVRPGTERLKRIQQSPVIVPHRRR